MKAKTIIARTAISASVIVAFLVVRHEMHARADESLPSKVDALDLAQLDAASAHIALLQQQAAPYVEVQKRVAAKYRMDLQRDTVDPVTGEIHRVKAPAGR